MKTALRVIMHEIDFHFCQLKPNLTGESDGLRLEFGIEMLRYSCKQLQKRRKLVKIKIDTIF